MNLCIISHTEHYKNEDDLLMGWGPTITEINYLTELFEKIYHVAMLHEGQPPPSALPYTSDKINFIPLPPLGGNSFRDKLNMISKIPSVIETVQNTIDKSDYFQLRCPTGIGVFLIPYLTLFSNKKGWYKYAGNWNQKNPPLGYLLQRFFLKKQNRLVTINGSWEKQQKQCISFENPSINRSNIEDGKMCISVKDYSDRINFCFVGRLEDEKGVSFILNALKRIKNSSRIGEIHFVGEGPNLPFYKKFADRIDISIIFHGSLPRNEVFEIYKKCHVFLLPSVASEGFPKVIAEALCYGCVPIVSNVSAIGHYINDGHNGIVLTSVSDKILMKEMKTVLNFKENDFRLLLENNKDLVNKFSLEYYLERIKNDILSIM